ncbi:hypothetical protein [Kamptonema formosum]|uniref:hypothetical protein n=1 Tax=Kamptonema formosum TaxID=331992 RepID=UPI000348252E|nr:hypothetical protein [Oscillatoria sp. PCC 10802]
MFPAFSDKPIASELSVWAEQIEKQSPGLSVLAARQFRYKMYQTPVDLNVTEPRKFNVLEEFILRASFELFPPPTENELASVLGLDPLFVRNTTAILQALQTLEVAPGSPITLTPQGRELYQKGSVPQSPKLYQLYALADPLQETTVFRFSPLDLPQVDLPDWENFIPLESRCGDVSELPLEEVQQWVQASGLGLHVPEQGKIVTSAAAAGETEEIWQTLSIFLILDVLEDNLTLQVRRGKQILEKASDRLKELESQNKLSLADLCEVSEESLTRERHSIAERKNQEVEARLEKIRQKSLDSVREMRALGEIAPPQENPATGSAVLLRDSQIRQTFLETLKSGCYDILIYSPWVTQEVVDSEFIQILQNLASRGVWVLIGHGIARKQEDEDRPIPPEVEAKLREVKTPEGLPAVQVFWLGNSHAKEVVVDGKIHLCGSHNWLSYRGDRLPRGETVYKVTIPETVGEAYKSLASRFQSHAQQLWDEAVRNCQPALAESSLCIWGALGMEEMALNRLQEDHWLELMPVWLKVVRQGLRSKKISPDSACFGTALSLLSQISAEHPTLDSLREEWQKVVGAIAGENRETALILLSEEVWAEFVRLGIAQPATEEPVQFISTCEAAQKPPVSHSKGAGKIPSKPKGKNKK